MQGSFIKILIQTLPVLMGYLPLGMAFGILFSTLNIEWYYGILCSLLIFTGAGQFLLVSLLALKSGYLEIAFASFMLNIRHIFYSLAILDDIKEFGIKKYYILFGLTDETFATLKTSHLQDTQYSKENRFFLITLLNHMYWILGGALGIFMGQGLGFQPQGVEFALTALFSVLTLALLQTSDNKIPFFIGLAIGIFGLIVFPSEHFLLFSMIFGILLLIIGKNFIERKNICTK
ncbi:MULTISPECIES: AzlC family ABC transporter permease [Helicobacter]|uniref:AzlC family ABC transporter permease n=1 Tax=Helicobacter ibis TaxID=2962633 RepID=A0ABT4VDI2_9HELI|nr:MULTISPECIES: AzlC family ABC transporter permease [Helicobacter]MDA3966620.1 AzlC family ABC transporter permease [Helicobacter sp. WB40]MDA3968765.1 AzlC family ABC transporter permease [Helicobacter ibis]